MNYDELLQKEDVKRAGDGRPQAPGMEERTGTRRSNMPAVVAVILICLMSLLVGTTLITQSINDSKAETRTLTGKITISGKK